MTAGTRRRATVEEYLEVERNSDIKHEFVNGEIWAMAGATPRHATITANTIIAIGGALRGTSCRSMSESIRVKATVTGEFFHPDVTMVCGTVETAEDDRHAILNPKVIVEVLSPSTSNYDFGDKWLAYQTIESLHDYVLIAQNEPAVTHYHRLGDAQWLHTRIHGLDAELKIESVGVTLRLADIYDGYLDVPGE